MAPIHLHIGNEKKNLLAVMQEEALYLPAYCGGKGTCGKCKVRFLSAAPKETASDLACLGADEIQDGFRLACKAEIAGDVLLEIPESGDEAGIVAESAFLLPGASGVENGLSAKADGQTDSRQPQAMGNARLGKSDLLAVDIGTTTLAASRLDPESGEVLGTATAINRQRSFGADVISRIDAANHGHGRELQELLLDGLAGLCRSLGADPGNAEYVISGNTTMEHLLQAYPCQSLGIAPYTPYDISLHHFQKMQILPGISTYVGADIVSGIIACGMDRGGEISLLVDLGTNGEMALGNKERMLCASTAAGPAFEGGNIRYGVAGIPGAISSLEILEASGNANIRPGSFQSESGGRQILLQTLDGKEPIGICGTGVLEIVYELLKTGLMDETGLLDDKYFAEGFPLYGKIHFTNKDVREVQLAKSAIRAGVEVLLQEYGITYREVSKVYLAGGFGRKINVRKAVGIGLLPAEFLEKVVAIGNSSLAGAVLYAQNPALAERFRRVAESSKEIPLAESAAFNEFYMENMLFPEE